MTISLKTYSKYKNSGVEWLHDIPVDWDVLPFKKIFRVSNERVEDTPSLDLALSISGYRGIEPRNIDTMEGQMPSENIDKYRIVRKGQLAVNTMWLNFTGLGVSGYDGYISPAYRAYDIDHVLDKKFAHHLLRSLRYVQKYSSLLYGLRPNSLQVKNDDFEKIEILVPPLETQKAIAAFLDERTKAIDELVAKKEKLIGLLREKRKSLITQVVTKGLDPEVKMKSSGIEWLGDVPKHWDIKPLKAIFNSQKKLIGADPEKYTLLRLSLEGVFPKQEGQGGKNPANYEAYQLYRPGDLVFCTFDYDVTPRTIGLVEQSGILTGAYTRLIPVLGIHAKYYYYFYLALDMDKVLLHLCTGLRHGLSKYVFWGLSNTVPPQNEQEQIVAYLDAETGKIKSAVSLIESQIEQLKEYRSSLIYSAVTGKIKI